LRLRLHQPHIMASLRKPIRYRKLNVKTPLAVLREDEVDSNDYESLPADNQIATGVEQAEEREFHLQKVLQAAAAAAATEIPVPPPTESDINYDALYSINFAQPANYIRFSQTVEECIGCQYDMTEDDDTFLKVYNSKKPAQDQISEDVFEEIMWVFEDTAAVSTPFASVDKTVVGYDLMVPSLSQLDSVFKGVMAHAKDVYEYWKQQRLERGGPIHPIVKGETSQETDDMDPYVCFRRREVRQTRKTRARDVQSAEKLKRLRRELEDGRQLIMLAHQRELYKREMLNTERAVFEQRARVKDAKVRLGIKGDDDDLINQKVRSFKRSGNWSDTDLSQREKKKALEVPLVQRTPGTQLRLPVRPDGRSAEADLTLLSDLQAEKENLMRAEIELKIENHRRWNLNHIDLTRDPLGPIQGENVTLSFRPAKTQYLMTPPTSASSGGMEEPEAMDLDGAAPPVFQFRGIQPPSVTSPVLYRRRIGRLGRLFVDRRRLHTPPPEEDSALASDRWKYDSDEDEDHDAPVYDVDPFTISSLQLRANVPLFSRPRVDVHQSGARPVGGTIQYAGQPQPPQSQPQSQGAS
jgi:enhancer of polycomb-like protein